MTSQRGRSALDGDSCDRRELTEQGGAGAGAGAGAGGGGVVDSGRLVRVWLRDKLTGERAQGPKLAAETGYLIANSVYST